MTQPDRFFSDLPEAVLRAPVNIHRLQQLAFKKGGLAEETITDLLLNEMIGTAYAVEAACPGCSDEACRHWGLSRDPGRAGVQAKPLTRYEEGGNKKHGAAPAAADWVLEVSHGAHTPARMMFQAKAGRAPRGKKERRQLDDLISAAARYGAAPLYVIYVKQGDAHAALITKCVYRTSAAETSMFVVAAHVMERLFGAAEFAELAKHARPLACIGGCRCLETNGDEFFAAASAFLRDCVPDYDAPYELPPVADQGIPSLEINSGVQSIARRAPRSRGTGEDAIFVVRAGKAGEAEVDSKANPRRIGWHTRPPLTDDEWREATRMYWRMNAKRALNVRYVVASHRGRVYRVYEVKEHDGVIRHEIHDGRIEFRVDDVSKSSERYEAIAAIAEQRLREVRGSQAPFVYADMHA